MSRDWHQKLRAGSCPIRRESRRYRWQRSRMTCTYWRIEVGQFLSCTAEQGALSVRPKTLVWRAEGSSVHHSDQVPDYGRAVA